MNRILHKLVGPAGLLLGIALANPSIAQVQSSASASNLRYVLGDLRPADGLAPAMTITLTGHNMGNESRVLDTNGAFLFQGWQRLTKEDSLVADLDWGGYGRLRAASPAQPFSRDPAM